MQMTRYLCKRYKGAKEKASKKTQSFHFAKSLRYEEEGKWVKK